MVFIGAERTDTPTRTSPPCSADASGHRGYVAGRYRNGSRSDHWTDVTRCAEGTFRGYLPACTCGWEGAGRPSTPDGYQQCRLEWARQHSHAAVLDIGTPPRSVMSRRL